jgi:hypothetical protein
MSANPNTNIPEEAEHAFEEYTRYYRNEDDAMLSSLEYTEMSENPAYPELKRAYCLLASTHARAAGEFLVLYGDVAWSEDVVINEIRDRLLESIDSLREAYEALVAFENQQ